MVAIDLDGTLLNSQKRISCENLMALQEAFDRGVEIVPVTGRNFSFALPIAEMLPFEVPLVVSNGAVIRSRRGETYLRCLLPVATARHILEITADFHPYTVVIYDQPGPGHLRIQAGFKGASPDKIAPPSSGVPGMFQSARVASGVPATAPTPAVSSGTVATSTWLQRNRALLQSFPSLLDALDGDPLEVSFIGPLSVMCKVVRSLESDLNNSPPSDHGFRLLRTEYPNRDLAILDVINRDCSKGRALEHWSRLRGIAADEIMAIGDNFNDLEMLHFAGLPVVMGNADESLKRNDWALTLDCDSSGVAHALRRFVL